MTTLPPPKLRFATSLKEGGKAFFSTDKKQDTHLRVLIFIIS